MVFKAVIPTWFHRLFLYSVVFYVGAGVSYDLWQW
nr:MAG TPA: SIR2 family protein [Caudoviricetes sp.]